MKEKDLMRTTNDATPLLDNSEHIPELSCSEKVISHCCIDMPIPLSYFFQSGMERHFRDKIASKDKEIVIDQPTIAFRADSRGPDKIFQQGFSVYSAKRLISKTCTDGMFCCPVSWLCCMPINLFACMLSYLPKQSSDLCLTAPVSPGDCFGQNRYLNLFATGSGALALAKTFSNANGYYANSKDFWRYIVYLPNGYIDFSAFCESLKGPLIDRLRSEDTGPHNIGEIIPKGRQKISKEYIVAAIKYESDNLEMWGGVYSYMSQKVTEIQLNKDFVGYENFKKCTENHAGSIETQLEILLKAVENFNEPGKNGPKSYQMKK